MVKVFDDHILKLNIESHYEDLALIENILQKDEAALEKLYYKYSKRLNHFINSYVPSYDDGQDILQTTFISALDALSRYNGASRFFTWLCAIARNKIADHYRASRKPVESLEALALRNNWQIIAQDKSRSVEEWLLDKELSKEVRTVIGIMSEHYRSLLVDKYLLGKPLKELAAARAISEKAAESLLTRARRYFKRLVEENDYFSGGTWYEK